MNKLSKTQLNLLEFALAKLYSHLKMKYNVDYTGNILCMVYDNIVHLNQCSCPEGIAWFADIYLKERKIHLSTRKVERDTIYSKFDYELFYMGSKPTIHTVSF